MPQCSISTYSEDFVYPDNIAQLADDTSVLAENRRSLKELSIQINEFTKEKYQVRNDDKTTFIHFNRSPDLNPIILDNDQFINAANMNQGQNYLGMIFTHTNDLQKLIEINLNAKWYNVPKFYSWLFSNESMPIKYKLTVLKTCIYSSILYGVETWGCMDKFKNKLLKMERKMLKSILGVKQGTSNHLLYIELNMSDIMTTIKKLQSNFYLKLSNIHEDDAIVKKIMNRCLDLNIQFIQYYQNIDINYDSDIYKNTFENSTSTMNVTYKKVCGLNYNYILYNSNIDDNQRKIITRWRLSSIPIKIETMRYKKIPQDQRKCTICLLIEDEYHILFKCTLFISIRRQFKDLLDTKKDVKSLLNPSNIDEITTLANYLKEIELTYKNYYSIQ